MIKTKFKVLMHCGVYVDMTRLEKGIYASNMPYLYDLDNTIEDIDKVARRMVNISGNQFLNEKYFENLHKCKLVEISISINEK
jgi:hypothetical protein